MMALWTSRVPLAVVVLLLLQAACCIDGHKPVIIVHGIFDGPEDLKNLSTFIKAAHPDTEVHTISLYNHMESLVPLCMQVEDFRKAIEEIMSKSPEGVHLLCFSQGGVICRAVLSTSPNHNVHTFIALSSPLAGQYGDTDYMMKAFPDSLKEYVYLLCYNKMGQDISVCDYWNDPHHRADYLSGNTFLPLLNGEKPHMFMKEWRDNFLRIKKLVMIGGPDDGVITPWQSSHYGFYNASEYVVEMKNQEFYKNDTFGLKTLDARGDVSVCVQSGVEHTHWHSNITVFNNCIEKWLI
ncbi:lysosomal thioesterase PPT2 isoform X4 [Fundulus heteroclitus]|uniref:lysosomal thioesterase PPT2 isoform X4 n=1 Tax=Fundulus heteroclitus TaxID=8078 RepID=UPI00165A2DA5|nr:lysosomal thioesterase PPT2 isoform X4 [Fundulus heteroclitus]